MKQLNYIFLICISFLYSGSAYAQNDSTDYKAVKMLKEFYTAYLPAWSTRAEPKIHDGRLYSLQSKYCTIEFRENLKKWGLDQDPLINDEATDAQHLNTLTIIKDSTKLNAYIVSYIDHTYTAAYKPIDKTVVVYVKVKMVNGKPKIASAYGDAVR